MSQHWKQSYFVTIPLIIIVRALSNHAIFHEIGTLNCRIALKFDRHIGSTAAEVPVKFQSDRAILNTNLAVSRLYEILRKDPYPIKHNAYVCLVWSHRVFWKTKSYFYQYKRINTNICSEKYIARRIMPHIGLTMKNKHHGAHAV